ncbi:hypothetical protein ACROYT_G023496 [Oculina patagonica]
MSGGYRTSDLSRGMTLRNASENRRLVGHLQHLDLQLHQNLVNLQAEIVDLKLARNGMSHYRQQRPKTTVGKTFSDPRLVKDRQLRPGTKISPLAVKGSSKEISKPFLPQISPKQTALVSKRVEGVETRPNSSRHPASSRRLRELSTDSANLLSTNTTSNLYRPKSTPNLCISPTKSESSAASSIPISDPVGGRRVRSLDKADKTLRSRSSEDLSQPSLELSDRVSDFLKRPNTSSGERIKEAENELKRSESDVIPTINIEVQEEEIEANLEEGKEAAEDDKGYMLDEELFRNSLLLKASRDDGLSRSMPDLSSLGFMDFNEVIDQRLRKLQEEIPSEEEMRKIRYLRFRDEPAPLPILSVFEKESTPELDKIDE